MRLNKSLIFIVFATFIASNCTAQNTITITKNTPVFIEDKYFENRDRENIVYVIKGYNPFATRINGKGEAINITPYKIPDIFSDVTAKAIPAEIKDSTGKKSTAPVGNKPASQPARPLADTNEAKKEKFISCYNEFIKNLQIINALYKMEDRLVTVMQDPQIDSTSLKNNVDHFISSISPTGNPRTDILKSLSDINSSYSCLKYYYDVLAKTLNKEEFTFKGKITDEKNDVVLNIGEAKSAIDRKKYFSEEYTYATSKFNLLNTDSIRTAIIYKVNNAADLQEKVANTPFLMLYEPGNDYTDGRKDTIRIESLKGELIQMYGPYVIRTKGQLKVDISAGYLISLGGDENYSKTYDAAGKPLGIQQNKNDVVKHNIGILFHAYWKWEGDISIGISGGFSIPIESSVNFYLGPSIFFNSKSRFIITAGISATKLKIINTSNLKNTGDKTYDFTNPITTDVVYDNIYRAKAFIGITYNILSVK